MKTRIFLCDACGRRRRHTITEVPKGWTYRCSQGHTIFRQRVGLDAATRILKDVWESSISAQIHSTFPLLEHFRR